MSYPTGCSDRFEWIGPKACEPTGCHTEAIEIRVFVDLEPGHPLPLCRAAHRVEDETWAKPVALPWIDVVQYDDAPLAKPWNQRGEIGNAAASRVVTIDKCQINHEVGSLFQIITHLFGGTPVEKGHILAKPGIFHISRGPRRVEVKRR